MHSAIPIRRTKIWSAVLAVPLLLFLGAIFFSPYRRHDGSGARSIRTEILIAAPADSVFRYLGRSEKAGEWSVFVSRIETLNGDEVPDGSAGSRRRCYARSDTSMQWDELTTIVEANRRRRLSIYNLKNFPVTASGLVTEQQYDPVDRDSTRLVFTVFYEDAPTWGETLKLYFAAYRIASIFKENLRNIKKVCEGGPPAASS